MLLRNREVRRECIVFAVLSAALTAAASFLGSGLAVLSVCVVFGVFHFLSVRSRYGKLQKLSEDLDKLLTEGIPLGLQDYNEGELSILGVQIQKMTLRLQEAADTLRKDKVFLADSLADISHQLRTPLTAMNLTAALLSAGDLKNARRQELVLELKQLLGRTQWLVEALLKFSRLDAGTVKMEPERMELRQLIRKAAEPLTIPMELRDQQLEVSCSGSVTVDPAWTAEALGNILKNCMEHTPVGGHIRVKGEECALFCSIVIEDTGGGFRREDIPRLFERFYKGKSGTGIGIGLAMARSVINRQNGTVQAANVPGGAQFVIKFYKQVI